MPPDRVAAIISPVASALDAAHRVGLVHRDVKPSNMLMDVLPGRPAHVYLSDFGVSKSLASTSGLTATGTILGTLAYMPPEQVRSQPVDGRSDQYALACSAYELLAGAPPFQRDEPAALMYAHLSQPPPLLTYRRPDLALAVDAVLSTALAKAPDDRYASCGQFADALRDALGLPPYRAGPAEPQPPAEAIAHPPAEAAWLETGDDARQGGPAPAGAAVPSPALAAPGLVAGPGHRHVGGRGRARHRWRSWRAIVVAACIAAAAGLAAGLLLMPEGPALPVATLPVSVKSELPTVTGDVYVLYQNVKYGSAEVSGMVSKTANGEVAALFTQEFPYKSAPAKADSITLRPVAGTARYAFRVTPTLATRYRIELFRDKAATLPIATSGVKTIYVSTDETISGDQKCSSPVCNESVQATVTVPPSVLKFEMSKTPQVYFGINLSNSQKNVPPPQWVSLGAGHSLVAGKEPVSADQFEVIVTFSYTADGHYNHPAWAVCDEDTEAIDGIGLPGHHGCGDQRILDSTGYYLG
jgi:hypothetical protein